LGDNGTRTFLVLSLCLSFPPLHQRFRVMLRLLSSSLSLTIAVIGISPFRGEHFPSLFFRELVSFNRSATVCSPLFISFIPQSECFSLSLITGPPRGASPSFSFTFLSTQSGLRRTLVVRRVLSLPSPPPSSCQGEAPLFSQDLRFDGFPPFPCTSTSATSLTLSTFFPAQVELLVLRSPSCPPSPAIRELELPSVRF